MSNIKILICDDHPICQWGLHVAIEKLSHDSEREYFFASSGNEALSLSKDHQFDFVFMDMKLPDSLGIDIIRLLSQKQRAKFIVLTSYTNFSILNLLRNSIKSLPIHALLQKTHSLEDLAQVFILAEKDDHDVYLCKDFISLFKKLDKETILTKREYEITQLIAQGLTTKEIALKLSCSQETIKSHRSNILNKTKMRNVAELSAWYAERYGHIKYHTQIRVPGERAAE